MDEKVRVSRIPENVVLLKILGDFLGIKTVNEEFDGIQEKLSIVRETRVAFCSAKDAKSTAFAERKATIKTRTMLRLKQLFG